MKLKSYSKQRMRSVQGLRSFKDTLPVKVRGIIKKKGRIYSGLLDNWRSIVGDDLFKICDYEKIWEQVDIYEAETNKEGKILLDNFSDAWNEVDAKLTELADTDMQAYANMMMSQNIVLETNKKINEAMVSIISSVIEKLTNQLDNIDAESDELAQDLAFEIQGLEQLVDELLN